MRRQFKALVSSKRMYLIFTLLVYIVVFLLLGEKGYLLWKDSPAYLAFDNRVGIMPIYPLLLYLNKILFGDNLYLYFVVAEQTIFSMVCVFAFTEFVRKRFRLSYIATYPIILLAVFMPFTVNYPLSITNHDIMTEALAYPLFYIYMIFFLKTIFDKEYKMLLLTVFISVGLALIRTQLQLINVFNAVAFFYITLKRMKKCSLGKMLARFMGIIIGCIIVVFLGEGLVLGGNAIGQKIIASINSKTSSLIETGQEKANKENVGVSNVTEQYGHLVIDKAVFEIDEDDYLLFSDVEMQKLCQAIFAEADNRKSRYIYARNDLWIWQDIMDGIASGTSIVSTAWDTYLKENPDTYLTSSVINDVAGKLLIHHIDRVVYHTFRMMPQGFICTVFFQKANIYLLCHIVTAFIYLSSVILVIWIYCIKEIPNKYAEFLLMCVIISILLVLILTILFFAMQRYLIYCFGIFYTAYYLSVIQVLHYYRSKVHKEKRNVNYGV